MYAPSGAGIPRGRYPLQVGGTAPHVVSSLAQQVPIPALSGGTLQVPPASTAVGSSGAKVPKAQVKLPSFSGAGSLEMFLAKFKNMARYLSWDEADRYYHLCALLEGAAGQVLLDAVPQATSESVLSLLSTRFLNRAPGRTFQGRTSSKEAEVRGVSPRTVPGHLSAGRVGLSGFGVTVGYPCGP